MAHVDALRMVKNVRKRLVDLAVSENYLRDSGVADASRAVWDGPGEEGGLVSELWVEGAFPGKKSSDTLTSLSDEGIFPEDLCRHIKDRDVFPINQTLYKHQSEAVRATSLSGSKPSIVITAGTGLGKTEAFLLPILSDLWTAPERKENGGMRCLILYPMNALIADQVDRIYRWLKTQTKLTVFHFTSETPENAKIAAKRGIKPWDSCRMRTRQQARGFESHNGVKIESFPMGKVPDIVITNYSMLEYMLCRPQDSRFFGPDLRAIVLDEAHLYSGNLAAEITMLLRRVKDRCRVNSADVFQIATSATLGGDEKDLRAFTAKIFSVSQENTKVIRGVKEDHEFELDDAPPANTLQARDLAEFASYEINTLTSKDKIIDDDPKGVEQLSIILSHIVAEDVIKSSKLKYTNSPARFLYSAMKQSPVIRMMATTLAAEKGSVISLEEMAGILFGGKSDASKREATICLLRLASTARIKNAELPLVPIRLHFLVRAPEGLSCCLNPECNGPKERKIAMAGCLQSIGDTCRYCGHKVLPMYRCNNCGEWMLFAYENKEKSTFEPGYFASNENDSAYYLLNNPENTEMDEVVIETKTGETHAPGFSGTTLWLAPNESKKNTGQQCHRCLSSLGSGDGNGSKSYWEQNCRGLVGGLSYALSVTAETVLHDMPPFSDKSKHWKPAQGRRLLAFSDSRAAAARLGPSLTQQHEMQIVRAVIARSISAITTKSASEYLRRDVRRLEEEIKNLDGDLYLGKQLDDELLEKQRKLAESEQGAPFLTFAHAIAEKRSEISELIEKNSAKRHEVFSYSQNVWKENTKAVKSQMARLIARELERPSKRKRSLESVGLVEIVYPGIESFRIPISFEEKLPSGVRSVFNNIWTELLAMLLDSIRAQGCIDFSDEKLESFEDESPLMGRWMTKEERGWNSISFVGKTQRHFRVKYISNVLRAAGIPEPRIEDLSKALLESVFDQLYSAAGEKLRWLIIDDHYQIAQEDASRALQIQIDKLAVREPLKVYRCGATGTVWNHSVLGWAYIDGCLGSLEETTKEALNDDPRWGRARREYLESPIFSEGLWAEEHSAQLSPEENRRLQELFKSGIRNILSSTTTMELGIDIGGLSGVLLGNVPPGPANHKQRAGRAGRRSDGCAVVVTYCKQSAYDREIFQRFDRFYDRELKKPTVSLHRDRIIRRHLYAVLLGEYLSRQSIGGFGAMDAYGRMGQFCGIDDIPQYWNPSSNRKPLGICRGEDHSQGFITFLERLLLEDSTGPRNQICDISAQTGLELHTDIEWTSFLKKALETFSTAVNSWERDFTQLIDYWLEVPDATKSNEKSEIGKANSIRYMMKALSKITVIEWLANYRFLPRYGFPINLQGLSVRVVEKKNSKYHIVTDQRYRLQRSALLALREYVPGSRVLVGGRIVQSRGLKKHWTGNNINDALGLQYFSLECCNGHVYVGQSPDKVCPSCSTKPLIEKTQQLLFPRHGYTTAAWEKVENNINTNRIGEQSVCPIAFVDPTDHDGLVREDFASISGVTVTYKEEANLLVRNPGTNGLGFAICTQCGFALSEKAIGKGAINLPSTPYKFKNHASLFSTSIKNSCWKDITGSAPVLRNRVLAAQELTDMLLVEWPGAVKNRWNGVYSLGRALVLSGTKLLEIDSRELAMSLIPLTGNKIGIVIYDTAPGGSGHCGELANMGTAWISGARSRLFVNEQHHATCEKACLDCILDFSGQYKADQLDRKAALNLMNVIML